MERQPAPKIAQESLRQSEERYRLLVEGIPDYAIFLLDPQGNVASWNLGAERITGYKAEEIIGQHLARLYPRESAAQGKAERELRTAAAQGRFEDEGWRVRKDGSLFWANAVLTALRTPDGKLQGFAKVMRDLTARVKAEEQARRLVREQAARVEAESAARSKDQFLAMLAHELRAPLAPLLAGLTLLRRSSTDGATRERTVEMMGRQLRHLSRMVDDLVDASRIARGTIPINRHRLDLAQLVRTTCEDHRPLLEQAGLALTVEAPETPLWVNGDVTRLTQVLTNLLDNARKFTPAGGRVTVRARAEGAARQAVLTVADTGIGVEAEILPSVFDALAQADRTLARSRGGLGLGLNVVRGLVELHGGEVRADSPGPGLGAELTVRLPLEEEPAALTQNHAHPTPASQQLRILVIEDNCDAAESLRMLMELLGHEVAVAHSGPEGLHTALRWQPDVVLSDIGLPGLSGLEVATELRRNRDTAKTRLVAISGYGSDEDRQRSRQAGFDFHLSKPADPEELERLLVAGR
jgi:PAS domain S-box-containing protein